MSIFLSTNTLAALQPAPTPPPTPSPQLGTGQMPSATGLMGAPDETGPVGMMGPYGQLQPGNIDLNNRPRVTNPDGSISTVRSISIDQDGKTYLIPTVVGNRVASNDEAIAHFQQTGEHLGEFTGGDAADDYAEQLHEQQAAMLNNTGPVGPMGPFAPPLRNPYDAPFQPGGDYGGGQLVPQGSLSGDFAAAGRGYAGLTSPGIDPESAGGGPFGHLVGALTTPATYAFGPDAIPGLVGAQLGGEATQYALQKPISALPQDWQGPANFAAGLAGNAIGGFGVGGMQHLIRDIRTPDIAPVGAAPEVQPPSIEPPAITEPAPVEAPPDLSGPAPEPQPTPVEAAPVPSGYNADPALADQPFRSPEQIQQDIEATTAQSMGGQPGDINPAYATQAVTPAQLPADAPPQQLLQAGLDQGASLWAQRQQAVSDLYKSQIARYQEAFERAGGGEAGDRAGRAAMSGNVADQPTFTPLQEVYSPQQIDSLYHSLDGLSGFTGTTARGAMRGMVERGIPPTPSQLEALSQVMPDLPAQLTRLGVYDLPPTSLAQNAKRGVLDFLNGIGRAPIQTLNNTGRTIETVGDVAAPGRLAPTAGAFMPKVYAESLGDLGKIEFAKDPKAVIANIWEGLRNDPDMQALGISPEDMFDKDTGFGMHGAGTDPYSGDLQPGGGVGLLKGSQRAQLLGNWMQVLRPQMLREHILNTIKGAGDETAQAAMKQRIMSDGAFRLDLGHSIDLVTGHSAWRPFGDESQLLVNFGNWFAAQGELIAKGAVGGAKGAANVIPGVNIPVSSTEAVARTALGRLAALGTMATVAINGINGVDPRDPRASRNGVPMVVITPALAKNLSNVPVIGRLLHFTPNTQQDIYGPIGEYIQHAAGVGIGAVKGTTSATGGIGNEALGAAKGAGGEAAYWGRGLLAWVPGVINNLFIAKDNFGQPNTLANNMPLPFNVSGFVGDAQRSTGTTIGSMLGGRFHEPSANAQLDAGTLDYWKMSADQQFKAVRHQSWLSLEDMFPADTKGFASYFDWYSATKDDFEKQLESQGLSPSAAQEKAQQFLQLHPIVKTYTDMHNQLEDQWGMDHPQEAAKLLNAEADVPWQDKTFRPTKQLQESLQAIPAGAK